MKESQQGISRTWIIVAAVVVALGAGLTIGALVLGGDDDGERVVELNSAPATAGATGTPDTLSIEDDGQTISDAEIQRIADAATAAVNGGQVTDIERSDDPGEAFEVEVVRGGQEIDVALDENLKRVPNQRFTD